MGAHVLGGVNNKFIFKMLIYFFIGKALCNVSTTSNHNPDQVLDELTRALVAKGIPCQQKGYILRGKIKDASGMAKLSFELEVCRIPNLNVVGIRRKRLKGDAWC